MAVSVLALLAVRVRKRVRPSLEPMQALLAVGLLMAAMAVVSLGLRLVVWMAESERRLRAL